MTPLTLRDYQLADIQALRDGISRGVRRQLLVEPTGAGKGTSITYIIQRSVANGKRVMFLCNRRILIEDMSRRVDALGIAHGVIMADHQRNRPFEPVQVASIDTLQRRPAARLPKADILIIDEAHFAVSPVWLKVLERYPQAVVLGATATPCRLDSKGLGHIFQEMVMGPTVADLTTRGYLVPARTFAPPLKGVEKVRKSTEADIARFMQDAKRHITGDAVDHWKQLAKGMPTVAFCCTIEHSLETRNKFRDAGIRAEHVDCNTPSVERDRMWERLKGGDVEIVTSVGIISFGWDCPPVSCAVLLRPTASLALHLQMCGRILRPYPGKPYALILDHAGNTHEHGTVEEPRQWDLKDGLVQQQKEEDGGSNRSCKVCFNIYPSTMDVCPVCGAPYEVKKRVIAVRPGQLEEIAPVNWFICLACNHKGRLPEGVRYENYVCPRCQTGAVKPIATKYDNGIDRKTVFLKLVEEQQRKGYKQGWSVVQFHLRFRAYPQRDWIKEAKAAQVAEEEMQPA